MSLAYRAVPDDDDHRTAYRRHLQYAFAPERGPDPDDDPRERPDEFEPRGLYDIPDPDADTRAAAGADTDTDGDSDADDAVPDPDRPAATDSRAAAGRPPAAAVDPSALVVCGALVDFRMRVRGAWRRVGGVSAVASPPEHRRRGHVATLLDAMHAELRDRGVAVAALWPFSHPFYARFGYGRANDYAVHDLPPAALDAPAARPADDGTLRRLTTDDLDALSAVHEASAVEPLAVRRSADWWRLRIFRSWSDDRYVYGWADDTGDLRSYLAYRIEEGEGADDGRRLVIDYWGAADEEAYRGLLAFLRNHDSQVSTVRFVAPDAGLLDRLSDPGEAETTVNPGPMVRVVDVEAALAGLSTPADPGAVALRVHDGRHAWNDGTFVVDVADGRTTCRRADAGSDATAGGDGSDGEAVSVDVDALSRLVVGARSAADLARLGGVDGDDDAVARLDALLPRETPAPYLREFF
jgi:predicted acetyltransferase